jgi:hypothetical protein
VLDGRTLAHVQPMFAECRSVRRCKAVARQHLIRAMQGGASNPGAVVIRLWLDVTDDIHRQDAESAESCAITELQPPQVESKGATTVVKLPVRAGVNLARLEEALIQLHNEECGRPRQGALSSCSSSISVRPHGMSLSCIVSLPCNTSLTACSSCRSLVVFSGSCTSSCTWSTYSGYLQRLPTAATYTGLNPFVCARLS